MELNTYIINCLKNKKIIRWPENSMPISVYVAPFRWYKAKQEAYGYNQMVLDALNIWQRASNNKVSFKIVNNLNDSQINIDWKRVDRTSLGQCYFNYDNSGRLFSAEIQIGLSDGIIHARYQDKNEVFHTILHEIGHSIGLDHSPYVNDIMYVPHQYGIILLSERDIKTLRWLYKFPYGIEDKELIAKYGLSPDYNIDQLVYKLEYSDSPFKNMLNNQVKSKDKDLYKEQDMIAKINKYNLSLQNMVISDDIQEYLKKLRKNS